MMNIAKIAIGAVVVLLAWRYLTRPNAHMLNAGIPTQKNKWLAAGNQAVMNPQKF